MSPSNSGSLSELYLPDFQEYFQKKQGDVSLAFALFKLAPPEVAMRMMRENLITNLNELSETGVSLLGLRIMGNAYAEGYSPPVPTWTHWQQTQAQHSSKYVEPSTVWDQVLLLANTSETEISDQTLAAAMIFAGADPWVEWPAENYDKHTTCLASYLCHTSNSTLFELLLSHPQCPDVEYFENLRIYQHKPKAETWNNNMDAGEVPLLHRAVNASCVNLVTALLNKGMNVNARDIHGRTALFYALDAKLVKLLINHGADVRAVDERGKTVSKFWKTWLATANKTSEFDRLVIDKMKDNLNPDELRELQKPALLSEIMRGTKTNFETIYRKSKFTPATIFDQDQKGQWDLLTAALLRTDERAPMFIRWALDKGVSWGHLVWDETPCTNAQMAAALAFLGNADSRCVGSALEWLRANTYAHLSVADLYEQFMTDQIKTLEKMVCSNVQGWQGLSWLGHMLVQELYIQKRRQESGRYYHDPLGSSMNAMTKINQLCGEKLGDLPHSAYLYGTSVANRSDAVEAFAKMLEHVVCHADANPKKGYNDFPGSTELLEHVYTLATEQTAVGNNSEPWERVLALLSVLSYLLDPKETDYQNRPTESSQLRKKIVDVVSARPEGVVVFAPSTCDALSKICAQSESSESLQRLGAVFSRQSLQHSLVADEEPEPASSRARRRM